MSKLSPTKPVLHQTEHRATGNDKLTGFLVLLANNETGGTAKANTVAEQTLFTLAIPANSCANILVEAIVQFQMNRSAAAKNVIYWYIKEGAVVRRAFFERYVNTTSPATITGPGQPTKIDVIISGGQVGGTNINITGAMMVANAQDSIKVVNCRIMGVI